MPPILKTIHTPDDTMAKVNAKQCAEAFPTVVKAIRLIDKGTDE